MSRAALAVAALLLAFVVSACERGAPPSPSGAPAVTTTPHRLPPVPPSPTPARHATAFPTGTPRPSATATPVPGEQTYTVQPGDTLSSIARRFGTTLAAIVVRNAIADPDRIEVGMLLVIPAAPAEPVSPPAAGASVLIRHGDRGTRAVALTFDMGGRVEPALDIMQWLLENDVPATIFITGAMVDNPNTDAGRSVLRLVASRPDLFELGNHSYSHADFRQLDDEGIRNELQRTERAVAGLVPGLEMRPRFRPPFGGVDEPVLESVGSAGYGETVLWDIDTADWRSPEEGGPTAAEIAAKVVDQAEGGSIVLMHLGGYETLPALPAIVEGLRDRGLALVRVSELLH